MGQEKLDLAARASVQQLEEEVKFASRDMTLFRVFNAMPEYVMLLNRQRQVVFANPVAEELACSQHGRSCVGMRLGELFGCDNLMLGAGCGTSAACATCGALETTLRALDGTKTFSECNLLRHSLEVPEALNLRVWGTPFPLHEQQMVLLVAVDISTEKRLEVLEQLFLHDVMNTAGVLQGMIDLMVSGVATYDEVAQHLVVASRMLVEEIQHQRILRDAELDALVAKYDPVSPAKMLESVYSVYHEHAVDKGKQLIISEVRQGTVSFVTDVTLLRRVLGNLAKNALEAAVPGDRVTLSWYADDERICFTCHNPQIIPPEIQYRLFTRSFSTKGKGRGVGTYSVKLLTERYLGGTVNLESTPDAGTTFTVCLPRSPLG